MEAKVVRFEMYPKDEPNGYAVGFNVTTSNSRSFYRDTVVPFEEEEKRTDEEIVSEAYAKLQDGIEQEALRLESLSPLLGMTISLQDKGDEPERGGEDEPIETDTPEDEKSEDG